MKTWEKLFTSRILTRGKQYFNQRKVNRLEISPTGSFSSYVFGSDVYHVRGNYHDGQVDNLTCTCPYAEEGMPCKHMAATIYAIERHLGVSPLSNLTPLVSFLQEEQLDANQIIDARQLLKDFQYRATNLTYAFNHLKEFTVNDEELTVTDDHNWRYSITGVLDNYLCQMMIVFNTDKIIHFDAQIYIKDDDRWEQACILCLLHFYYYVNQHNPGEGTNHAAQLLIDNFNHQKEQPQLQAYITQQFTLTDQPELLFKVGIKGHMYKISNLMEFVNQVYSGEPLNKGKYFNQPVYVSRLDASSQLWFQFIAHLLASNQVNDLPYGRYAFKNDVVVDGVIADDLDLVLQKGAVLYRDKYDNPVKYQQKSYRLALQVTGKGDYNAPQRLLKLTTTNNFDDLIIGKQGFYCFTGYDWIHYQGASPLDVKQLFPDGRPLTFGTETMTDFYYEVLPTLQADNRYRVTVDSDLTHYLPTQRKYQCRLDLVDEVIHCQVKVENNGQWETVSSPKDRRGRHLFDLLDQYFEIVNAKANDFQLSLQASARVDKLLTQGLDELKSACEVKATAAFKRLLTTTPTKMTVGIQLDGDLLDLKISGENLTDSEVEALLHQYHPQRRYYKLGRQIVQVDDDKLNELVDLLTKLGVDPNKIKNTELTVPSFRALYLEELLQERSIDYHINQSLQHLLKDLKHGKKLTVTVPTDLHATLRPYQKAGFQWLTILYRYHFGGLLADEMGLGKTLQMITLLASQSQSKQPSLIVAPAAVIYNWRDEFQKFIPQMNVTVLDGSKKQRQQLLANKDTDVYIVSYNTLKRDIELYQDHRFNVEVVDEAQYIKNPRTATTKAVKAVVADHRFAMTGTPIENRLSELWSIFDYLMPDFFDSYAKFKQRFEKPIVKDDDQRVAKELQALIRPFVLRRLKQEVLKDLPPRIDKVIYASLVGEQSRLYQARAKQLLNQVKSQDNDDLKSEQIAILAELTRLRQLCCSPALLYTDYSGKSGKLEVTLNLINDQLTAGHKILLFSQFTSMLAILKQHLVDSGYPVYLIEGATPKKERLALVKQFNQDDRPAIFLISLRAGGTGLNLTSADVVIHYDPWWNVAAQNQATDRAHRIGQHKTVTNYQIITSGTIEENILKMQKQKQQLADEIIGGQGMSSSTLTKDDLLKLLGEKE